MKYAVIALLLILLGLGTYLFLSKTDPVSTDQEDAEVMLSLQAAKDRAELKAFNVEIKARAEHEQHNQVTKAKDAEIARLKAAGRKAMTVHVDTVIQNDPELGMYVQYLDSIVVTQDSQIAELKTQTVDQWQSFNEIINASDSVSLATKELNERVLGVMVKQNKRLKRQNLALKIGIVAIPVGIVALVVAK